MNDVTHSGPRLCDCSIGTKSSVSWPKLNTYRTLLPLSVIGMLTDDVEPLVLAPDDRRASSGEAQDMNVLEHSKNILLDMHLQPMPQDHMRPVTLCLFRRTRSHRNRA